MYERCCNQNASSEMLCAEEERSRNPQARKLDHQNGKGAGGRRDEEDDEETTNVEWQVVVGLRTTYSTAISLRVAVNRRNTYVCELDCAV